MCGKSGLWVARIVFPSLHSCCLAEFVTLVSRPCCLRENVKISDLSSTSRYRQTKFNQPLGFFCLCNISLVRAAGYYGSCCSNRHCANVTHLEFRDTLKAIAYWDSLNAANKGNSASAKRSLRLKEAFLNLGLVGRLVFQEREATD